MEILQAILIFFGMSQDSFVIMMGKGATIRDLTLPRAIVYALIYAIADVIAITAGYGISHLMSSILVERMEFGIACIVIFSVGLYLCFKGVFMKDPEERLDRHFGLKNCFLLAIAASVDMLFVGFGYALLDVSLFITIPLVLGITFVSVLGGVLLGYWQGMTFTKFFSILGGLLMMGTAFYALLHIVLKVI